MSSDGNSQQFDVILLGFHQIQRTIIGSLCTLSHKRDVSYRTIANTDLFAADIILIDLHDQMVVQNFEQLAEVLGDIPVLFIGEEPAEGASWWLKRETIAGQLLDTLDRIVNETALESRRVGLPDGIDRPEAVPAQQEVEEIVIDAPAVLAEFDEDVVLDAEEAELTADEIANFGYGASLDSPDPFAGMDLTVSEDDEDSIVISGGVPDAVLDDPDPVTTVAPAAPPTPAVADEPEAVPVLAEPNPRFSKKRIVSDEQARHKLKVLVVDDSVTVWAQMKMSLDNVAADVDFIQTAEGGIELTRSKDYALIFMDVVLPGIDGYSACKIIKTDERTRETPVVMMTSKSAPANKVRGVLSGCSYYLTKPVDAEEVGTVIEKFMPAGMKTSGETTTA